FPCNYSSTWQTMKILYVPRSHSQMNSFGLLEYCNSMMHHQNCLQEYQSRLPKYLLRGCHSMLLDQPKQKYYGLEWYIDKKWYSLSSNRSLYWSHEKSHSALFSLRHSGNTLD